MDWAFKTSFSVAKEELALPNVDLVFDGLDTFAVVKLVSRAKSASLALFPDIPIEWSPDIKVEIHLFGAPAF